MNQKTIELTLRFFLIASLLTTLVAMNSLLPSDSGLAAPDQSSDHVGEIIIVDTFDDTISIHSDMCTDLQGYCSLRAAVILSNLWPGPQTIQLDEGTYTFTRAGKGEDAASLGDLDITGVVTITGVTRDATWIDADQLDRVFEIHDGAFARIESVSIKNGKPAAGEYGGGIAVWSGGTLTLYSARVSNNQAGSAGGTWHQSGYGGGIFNDGNTTIQYTSVLNNSTADGDGSLPIRDAGPGGGIAHMTGSMTITASVIEYNHTGNGGDAAGGYTNGGDSGGGGGIYASSFTDFSISDSVVNLNYTGDGGAPAGSGNLGFGAHGGGIQVLSIGMSMNNTVVSSNHTGSGYMGGCGGGIYIAFSQPGDSSNLTNVTVSSNYIGLSLGTNMPGCSGGGIFCNEHPLHLTNVQALNNTAGNGGPVTSMFQGQGGAGGGIAASQCALYWQGGVVEANQAGAGGDGTTTAGKGGAGGGLYAANDLVNVSAVSFINNASGNGGDGTTTAGSGGPGGGVSLGSGSSGWFKNTLIANNNSGDAGSGPNGQGGPGGGLYTESNIALTNTTVSSNTTGAGAYNGDGGGVFSQATLSLQNATIANNIALRFGGGVYGGNFNLKDTLLADNSATDGPDCYNASLVSQGYNLIETPGSCPLSGDTTGNQTGVDPALGPLQDNGGPTHTHALTSSSPAIDAGDPAPPGGVGACPADDQRYFARSDFRCDIGAFESQRGEITSMTRGLALSTPVTFGPMGASLELTSGATFSVTVQIDDQPPGGLPWPSSGLPVFWQLTPTFSASFLPSRAPQNGYLIDLRLCYNDAELGRYGEDTLLLLRWDGDEWVDMGAVLQPDDNCLLASDIDQLSEWAIRSTDSFVFLPIVHR